MNIQTFLYNENLHQKLTLTLAIIRSTPSHLSPKEYTIHLQNLLRKNQINEAIQIEQVLLDIRSLRKSTSINRPTKVFDLLEYYGNFLQHIFTISTEFDIEMQIILIETIVRIFQLMKENFVQIKQSKYETIFKRLINMILNYDFIPNMQQQTIEHIKQFIDLALIHVQRATGTHPAQMLIEQIGSYQSYFLLVFERILTELLIYYDRSNSNPSYGLLLINMLQKLVTYHDTSTLEQVLTNESVRRQFHALLYTCLSLNQNDISLVITLWNIYGQIC